MLINWKAERRQSTVVKRKRKSPEIKFPFNLLIIYLIRKNLRRNMIRTIAALSWFKNFFSRIRYQMKFIVR